METFQIAKCEYHSQTPSQYLSFQHQAKRVCTLCPIEGKKYVMSNESFSSLALASISQLRQNEATAMRRHKQLSELSDKIKGQYSQEDDELLKKMMKVLEQQNKVYKQSCVRIEKLRSYLNGVHKIIRYFETLKSENLYDMKISLSSQQGIKKLHKKSRDFAALIKKGVHCEFKKIEQKLSTEEKQLIQFEQQSLIFRLRQSLLSRKPQNGISQVKSKEGKE